MAMQEPGRTKGFPCKHCGTVCSNMPSLLEHMDSHSQQEEDRKFKCDECGRGYRHAGSLANHKKTHELGTFQCPVCARKLSNPLALKSHLRIHTSQKKYSCMDCGKAFRLATQLATHQKVHLSRQSKRRAGRRAAAEYSPIENRDEIEDNEDLHEQLVLVADQQDTRMDIISDNGLSQEEAEIIPISANYSENLGSDEPGDRPFKCDQCEKSYRHHGSLINHKKSHQVGMFECPICFKQFNNLAALHSHQRTHNKSRSGPDTRSTEVTYAGTAQEQFSPSNREAAVHFCHLCQVIFPNDDEFQEHIQMHNSSSMSFGHIQGSSDGYHGTYDHSVTHSPDSNFHSTPLNNTPSMDNQGEQINDVQIYSDHSSNESTLNTQQEPAILDSEISADDLGKAEQSSVTENVERRFKCQVCGKSYRHAGSLINHKRSHQTGIYQCSICRKTYPHMAALRSHIRIHRAHPSSFNLSSEGDWLSTEPLTLENQQACLSSQDGDASSMMALAQENKGVHDNGGSFHEQFDSTFPQERTVHLPHDEHLMERHMCADCGETFADIAGIKSHICPQLQQQQEAMSNDCDSNLTFQDTNGQCSMGNPGDHIKFQGLNGSPVQRYFGEHNFHEVMNGEQLNSGDGEEEDDEDDDGELYQCSVCGNRYTSMRALRSHLRGHTQSHDTPTSSGPSSMSSLEAEKEEDLGERQQVDGGLMICSTCGESFAKKQDMLAHQLSHHKAQADDAKHVHMDNSNGARHKEEVDSIICGNCGTFCTSYHHLETHQCTANGQSESGDERTEMGNSVNGKELGPMKADLDNGDRQYKCDQCGRAYRHAGSLLNHKKSHKTGVFRCMVCQKRFYNLLALKNHQRTHFDVKRHTCNECGKAFKIQKQLLNHLRIHKENKAKIQELNNQIQALMQMNGAGSEGGMHSLNAPANQSATTTRRKRRPTLNLKKPSVGEGALTASQTEVKSEGAGDPRPYSCDQCGRTYRHAGSLVNHKNSHKTGEYYCSVCNNTYSNQLAMKNHLRIHFSVKKHSCQHCGKAFRGKKQLSNHICAHLRKDMPGGVRGSGRRRTRNIKCKQCRLTFVSADQLTAHTCGSLANSSESSDGQTSMSLKKEERPFTCNICNRSYRHAGSLLNHKNTHKSGHFSCTFCSKPFSNPMALRNHTRIHTQKKKHVCLTCGKAFRLASILHNHQKVHTRVASHFSCPECGKSFQGKSGLKRHRCQSRGPDDSAKAGDSYHRDGGGDKCFMCDLCGRSYRHSGSLLNHKKTHSENLHHCTLCLQTFPDPIALQVHSQMKRHCCPDCGKTFCLVSHLQSHMEVHSKERTLVCSPCHQSFPNPASYQQHQDLHHRAQGHYQQHSMQLKDNLGWGSGLDQPVGIQGMPKLVPAFAHMHGGMPDPQDQQESNEAHCTGVKSHVCEHCGRTYRHAGSLLNHKNSHKTGSFFCSVCQKEFTNLMALKNHRRIHTEPKRYQCLECGKAFRVSTQLICHRRMHTKEKPFSCLLCDKSFSSKSNLRHHQKMHQSGAQVYESSFSMDANSFMDLDMGSFL
ncbi:zinc finger protein 646 isoform X1 [Salvelinus sp. IW2-2015]|uniref:zinc finger protein 646 isoform X1 n=2 Tax=Salvelinus sp. IW2-2015 TaxID=2691554 RepID=UPI000CDFC9CA|nr:zinc finger protein 850 [Salvelinus alpinus]XP_023863962.1 zinc finger protein 850 [Salvelinus alpinus]XP_023863963.1 zinc finger protein 850 [Salvelinus alpinus]XP_023863964.1 zinc finger protein 850 [Salvelinus alpinus]